MKYWIGILAVALTASAAQAEARKDGWWVRIDAKTTQAQSIQLSAGGDRASLTPFASWKPGAPTEFDLPDALRSAEKVVIQGVAAPHDADARLCVFYAAAGIEDMDFDGTETETIRKTEREPDCN